MKKFLHVCLSIALCILWVAPLVVCQEDALLQQAEKLLKQYRTSGPSDPAYPLPPEAIERPPIDPLTTWASAKIASASLQVICVPWGGKQAYYHSTWNGKSTLLKAVVSTVNTSPVSYEWNFGDGSPVTTGTLSGLTKYNVEIAHTYSGSGGTPFLATLTVDDGSTIVSDTYRIRIRTLSTDAEVDVAVDDGLWWLYKRQYADGHWASYSSYYAGPTASAVQAFEVNGHRENGDPNEDPYVDAVARGLQYLFNNRLQAQNIGPQTGGNPDANANGKGIDLVESNDAYSLGMVMDAIVASGTPGADCGRDFDGDGSTDTYQEVVQDMCDMYGWGQKDAGSNRGGWRYTWNSDSDNSVSQWAAIGMIPAEDKWGCVVPQWVKDYNNVWLSYSYYSGYARFGYSYWGDYVGSYPSIATRPSGMVQLVFCDLPLTDARWVGTEGWFANAGNWSWFINSRTYYGWFAFVKAMRLSGTEILSNGFDWYYGNDASSSTWGIARRLVYDQEKTGANRGRWPSTDQVTHPYYYGYEFDGAWAILMLKSLFEEPPMAVGSAAPNPTGQDVPVTFNASGSYHPESPDYDIVLIEWDFNNDGTYDWSSPDINALATHTFHCDVYPTPCAYPVALKVTDDRVPPLYDVEIITVDLTPPPHAPTADPNGPYVACSGFPVILNGSGSFDIDEHLGDYIVTYGWELDLIPPYDYDDAIGPVVTWTWGAPGIYDIGLRVMDTAGLIDDAWTSITLPDIVPFFELTASPAVARAQWYGRILGTAVYDVTVSSVDCYGDGKVSLSVAGFPVGYRRHYFVPGDVVMVPLHGSETVRLVVEVTPRTPVGDYVLTITGDDGSMTHTCTVTMEVRRPSRWGGLKTKMESHVPQEYVLAQNYPNPFNPETCVEFGLPEKSAVRLAVYNLLGQEVEVLVDGEFEAGYYTVSWDAIGLPTGVYFYRLHTKSFVETKRMVYMK